MKPDNKASRLFKNAKYKTSSGSSINLGLWKEIRDIIDSEKLDEYANDGWTCCTIHFHISKYDEISGICHLFEEYRGVEIRCSKRDEKCSIEFSWSKE